MIIEKVLENLSFDDKIYVVPVDGNKPLMVMFGTWKVSVDPENEKKLIAFPGNRTGSYTVPNTVEIIGFGAFENTKLTEVNFSENINLLTLGYRVFYNAKNLKEITIPSSVISIDY